MISPAELIKERGVAAFAEAIQVREGTVKVWKTRNKIPRKAWPEISAAYPDLTTERLLEIEKGA